MQCLLEKGRYTYLDVRPVLELEDVGRVPGAVNIPLVQVPVAYRSCLKWTGFVVRGLGACPAPSTFCSCRRAAAAMLSNVLAVLALRPGELAAEAGRGCAVASTRTWTCR